MSTQPPLPAAPPVTRRCFHRGGWPVRFLGDKPGAVEHHLDKHVLSAPAVFKWALLMASPHVSAYLAQNFDAVRAEAIVAGAPDAQRTLYDLYYEATRSELESSDRLNWRLDLAGHSLHFGKRGVYMPIVHGPHESTMSTSFLPMDLESRFVKTFDEGHPRRYHNPDVRFEDLPWIRHAMAQSGYGGPVGIRKAGPARRPDGFQDRAVYHFCFRASLLEVRHPSPARGKAGRKREYPKLRAVLPAHAPTFEAWVRL